MQTSTFKIEIYAFKCRNLYLNIDISISNTGIEISVFEIEISVFEIEIYVFK